MIIFDASTLILLAKTGLLDLLLDNYKGKVAISKEVERECCKKKVFDALLIEKRIENKKIIVKQVKNKVLCNRLMSDFNMSRGESEAIILTLEEKADILATDDKNAINACKLLKIRFTSAIDILIRTMEKGIIEREEAGLKLGELNKYGRYAKSIIEDAKNKLEVK